MMRDAASFCLLLAALPSAGLALRAQELARSRAWQHAVPGKEDAAWKLAVDQAQEVSELSDKIKAAQVDLQAAQRDYAYWERYYTDREASLRKQISIRERQVSTKPSSNEAEVLERDEKRYHSLMCVKLMDAFVFNEDDPTSLDSDKRLHVLKLCMGRESLVFLQRRVSDLDLNMTGPVPHLLRAAGKNVSGITSSAWPVRFNVHVQELGDKLRSLEKEEEDLETTGALQGSPADRMREMLQALEKEEAALQAKMRTDKAKWDKECDQLAQDEKSLGNQHYKQHASRQSDKEAAFQKAKDEFCPVVQQNYRINEDKIRSHVQDKCR